MCLDDPFCILQGTIEELNDFAYILNNNMNPDFKISVKYDHKQICELNYLRAASLLPYIKNEWIGKHCCWQAVLTEHLFQYTEDFYW